VFLYRNVGPRLSEGPYLGVWVTTPARVLLDGRELNTLSAG
jgi:hypothetical protein